MQTDKVLRTILARKGLSARQVADKMGRSPKYLDMYLYRKSVPKADTLASMLQACDFELIARSIDDGTEFPIDPMTE